MFDNILAYWLPGAQQREAERTAQAEQEARAAKERVAAEQRQHAYDHLRAALTTTFGDGVCWLYPHVQHTRTRPVVTLSDSGILLWEAKAFLWKLQRVTYVEDLRLEPSMPVEVALDRLVIAIHTFIQKLPPYARLRVCPSCSGTGWGLIAACDTCAGEGYPGKAKAINGRGP